MLKLILKGLGMSGLIASSFMFAWIFLAAYNNKYEIVVDINSIGEANFELGLLCVFMPLALWAAIDYVRYLRNGCNPESEIVCEVHK